MQTTSDRVIRAFTDVVAVEHDAPGMCRVVSTSGTYPVAVRERACLCPDFEYNLEGRGLCKHLVAALIATEQVNLDLNGGGHELVADLNDRHATTDAV